MSPSPVPARSGVPEKGGVGSVPSLRRPSSCRLDSLVVSPHLEGPETPVPPSAPLRPGPRPWAPWRTEVSRRVFSVTSVKDLSVPLAILLPPSSPAKTGRRERDGPGPRVAVAGDTSRPKSVSRGMSGRPEGVEVPPRPEPDGRRVPRVRERDGCRWDGGRWTRDSPGERSRVPLRHPLLPLTVSQDVS